MQLFLAMAIGLAFLEAFLIHADQDEENDEDYYDRSWEHFKKRYNKVYNSAEAEAEARDHFERNQFKVLVHNVNDEHNYTLGIHEHSDMPTDKAIDKLCGTDIPLEAENITSRNIISSRELECDSVDWVARGAVTPVKNQGSCGACWAFAAAQGLEGQTFMNYGKAYEISKQELLDCASGDGNNGCASGWPDYAMQYMAKVGGEVSESCYPYRAKAGRCRNPDCYRFPVRGPFKIGPSGDETAVANALCRYGPLVAAIYVDRNLMHYDGGIYYSNYCNKDVNHGVLIVGFGRENGVDYWKLKNSWGTGWGEKGYFRLERNAGNLCRIASYVSFPEMP